MTDKEPTRKEFSAAAETIMCPFCWPDDAAEINFTLRWFACSHCGTSEDFETFIRALEGVRDSRAKRIEADNALIERLRASQTAEQEPAS